MGERRVEDQGGGMTKITRKNGEEVFRDWEGKIIETPETGRAF